MSFRWDKKEHVTLAAYTLKWLALVAPMAAAVGCVIAFFIVALNWATQWRLDHPWILYGLPLCGAGMVWAYRRWGGPAERGINLIMDEIHKPSAGVPLRMAPFILLATIATHLFGGSAGREGTAVQIGGSLASKASRWLGLRPESERVFLMAGVAAGFGAVFGTPLAGALFAMEVLSIGSLRYEALMPCLVAALVGDQVVAAWGIHHSDYHIGLFALGHPAQPFSWLLAGKVAIAAAAFGLASVLFAELSHALPDWLERRVKFYWLRPVLGALAVIGLVAVLGTRDYIGLGISSPQPGGVSIASCFETGGARPWSWFWKIAFTVLTLGSGFKGGEVTPLFFVGAALGNTLAGLLHGPVELFAALGFVSVFAGATNTPLACTLMGVELFGGSQALYLALSCFIAYLFSGHSGIYLSQRLEKSKGPLSGGGRGLTLRKIRGRKPLLW